MLKPLGLVLRRLRHQPSFALAAIVTLALGIGASTAIFSALDTVLLRPLPYAQPENLYTLRTSITDGRFTSGLVGGLELTRLKETSDRVLAVAASMRMDLTIVRDAGAIQAVAYGVSDGYFDMFGLPMAAGRGFTPDEHDRGPSRVVVLSHRLWQQLYGGDPAAVGSALGLPTRTVTIVGVAHPAFDLPRDADLWYPTYLPPNVGHMFEGYMRLRPGTTLEAMRGPMAAVMERLAVEQPDQNKNRIFVARPMLDAVVGDLGPVLMIVFGATILLLVLAAANVTNLMLARGTTRAREVALRAALGASQGRLVRDLLLESLVLTAIGGALGVALAYGAVQALSQLGLTHLPRLARLTFEPRVLSFALVVMGLTGVLVALLPAASLLKTDIRGLVGGDDRTATGNRTTRRLLGGMIVAEIAVAIALVAGAGRLVRSFADMVAVDPGFTSDERLLVNVSLPYPLFEETQRFDAFAAALRERVRPLGVTAIGAISSVPLGHEWDSSTFVDFPDAPAPDPHRRPNARWRFVSPDLFDVLEIARIAGRGFTDADRLDTPGVAVVNDAFVRRYITPGNPIGARVLLPGFPMRMKNGKFFHEPTTIVGVVKDVQYASLGLPAEPTVYSSLLQQRTQRQSFVIATAGRSLDSLAPEIRTIVRQIDPRVPVDFERLSDVVAASVSRQRLGMILMLLFGGTALALAMVGVFGVIAYVTGQRLGEMALRLALGGSTASVFWLVEGYGLRLAVSGGLLGTLFAWWTGRLMMRFAAGTGTHETLVVGLSAAVVCAVALGATTLVARQAARVDPARVLRTTA